MCGTRGLAGDQGIDFTNSMKNKAFTPAAFSPCADIFGSGNESPVRSKLTFLIPLPYGGAVRTQRGSPDVRLSSAIGILFVDVAVP